MAKYFPYDYNRNLMVVINFRDQLQAGETVDPGLLTWEVQELIDWFNQLSKDEKPKWKHQEFIEPNLSLQLMNSHDGFEKKINFEFKLENRPQSSTGADEYPVEFIASNSRPFIPS